MREGNPQDNWSGHGQLTAQQPSLFYSLLPWQTFALQLSSRASQQLTPTLLSGNANQSLRRSMRQRRRRKGRRGNREVGNEGIEREGQRQLPESHKAKLEPLAKTNKKTGLSIDMHKQGAVASFQQRQKDSEEGKPLCGGVHMCL